MKISTPANNSSTDKQPQEQSVLSIDVFFPCENSFLSRQNVPRPVALTFDFLTDAAQCPLPDSGPSSPESNTEHSNFTFPGNQPTNNSPMIERQYKLIQIDEKNSFYLIRYNNKAYIPCFNLARLLHLSESDILSETVRTTAAHTNLNSNH